METNAERVLRFVRIKTDGAKHHIQNIEGLFEPGKVDEWVAFVHAKPDDWGEPVPIRITDIGVVCATGDAIHNLRSALDHLVTHLVVNAGNIPNEGLTGFPISDSPKKFEAMFEGKVAGMSSGAKDAIRALKP